jgi:uncharacterized protein (TIGR03437 family)
MPKSPFTAFSLSLVLVAITLLSFHSPLKGRPVRRSGSPAYGGIRLVNRSVPSSQAHLVEAFGKLPLSFEANQGQAASDVKFISRGRGYSLFLTGTEAVLALRKASHASVNRKGLARRARTLDEQTAEPAVLHMKLIGANPTPKVTGADELPGKVNYFIGNDPSKWRTNVPTYAKVRYENVYPGIDLVYYGNQGQLEYDFVVSPGSNPGSIQLDFDGAEKLEANSAGDLVARVTGEEIRLRRPVIYQQAGGRKRMIAGAYALNARNEVRFQTGAYDASKPLVIDPMLVYSTLIGGPPPQPPSSASSFVNGIAVDSQGNAYIAGQTSSTSFPVTSGAFQTTNSGSTVSGHAFISKLNASGTALIYSTFLGGSSVDAATAIALDSAGNAYVTGSTTSSDFPAASQIQPKLASVNTCGTVNDFPCADAFVAKLNASGNLLIYSTYLGGSGDDRGFGIAVDPSGAAFVAGRTFSKDFPLTKGAFQTVLPGANNAFIARIDPSGSTLTYSTYFGGSGADTAYAVAVDASGNAYVAGLTSSKDFPTTPGSLRPAFPGQNVDTTGFVLKLNPTGSVPVYSTYLGSSGGSSFAPSFDAALAIGVDTAGSAYVTGETGSTDFPTTPGAVQAVFDSSSRNETGPPNPNGFVTKLNPSGSALSYSTYLGAGSRGQGIAVDLVGNTYLAGSTGSPSFPLANPIQPVCAQLEPTARPLYSTASFVTKLNPAGTQLLFSTCLSGDAPFGLAQATALDSSGMVYVAGGGGYDSFVAKIDTINSPTPSLTSLSPTTSIGGSAGFTLTVNGANFIGASVVRWNGSDRPTTFVSLTSLTAAISASDLSGTGVAQVTVVNPAPGGGVSNALSFAVGTNPVPQLGSLSPGSAGPGSQGFLMTANGSSFVQGTQLQWNGSARPTTYRSSTQLLAAISASDLTASGTAQITVFNPPPGGGPSNALSFVIGAAPPPPAINPNGIVNGASFGNAPVTAGAIVSLFGTNFAATPGDASSLPLPPSLNGVSVQVNGISAPLFNVRPLQINFQIPWEMQGQSQVTVTATVNGVTSSPVALNLAQFNPGLFSLNQQGTGQGAILIGGTPNFAAPVGTLTGSRPARRGEFVTVFCTGLGAVNNVPASGAAVPTIPQSTTTNGPIVTVGGVNAQVTFSGLAPTFVGLYQVNFQVPLDAPVGDAIPVFLSIGGVASNTVTIAVQ